MMELVDANELAYVGLGANFGPARRAMTRAVMRLRSLPGASLEGVSRLYRTQPVGPVAQGDFLNAVVALRVPSGPTAERAAMALLIALKAIERSMGRRFRERWGPREIDLDLLLFGAHRLHVEPDEAARRDELTRGGPPWLDVPHPAAQERLFVLAPLADLAPASRPPGWGMSVAQARVRAEIRKGRSAVSAIGTWDAERGTWTDLTEPAAASASFRA